MGPGLRRDDGGLMRPFFLSYAVTLAAMVLAFLWAGAPGLVVCALMTAMEISFSFDNAVVNAAVLKHMDATWQRQFLTWGMLIATFGMYYLFPLLIVALATGLNLFEVMHLAINQPEVYSRHLDESHTQIASFGGMFLLMVFLSFMLNAGKQRHWINRVEKQLVRLGKLEAVEIIIALAALLILQLFLPQADRAHALVAGVFGVGLYVTLHSVTALLGLEDKHKIAGGYSGLAGFLYLNLLDASFSLDAVVGSFAISDDIVIIVAGADGGSDVRAVADALFRAQGNTGAICIFGTWRALCHRRAGSHHANQYSYADAAGRPRTDRHRAYPGGVHFLGAL